MAKDMTSGSPMKHILFFSVPLLFGFLFQQFYNLVDTMIVGKVLGVDALAAVGATGSINFLIIGFCMGICNGFAIPIAHKFGAGDYKGLRKFMVNAIYLSVMFAVVMTIITSIFCRQILEMMRTPDNIIDDAYIYIFIIFLGIPFTFLYNLLAGVIRSIGDSRTPVIFLVIASVINIVLDVVLIVQFNMGVSGAALATVISQAFSGTGCLLYTVFKLHQLRPEKDEKKFDSAYAKTLCGMGIPMGLQYSITAIGSVILQSSVNTLGSDAVAAVTAGGRISGFFCCPFDALGSTMATYGGQNMGAGKYERIKKGLRSCILLGAIYSVIALVVMIFGGRALAALFLDKDKIDIVSDVYTFLILNSAFYFPLALVNIVRFMIQGMGYSKFAILAGVCEMAARSFVGFALVPAFGYIAACTANPAAWIAADIFLIPAFRYVYSKHK